MTGAVPIRHLGAGDKLAISHREPVIVEELVHRDDGRIVVRWWRPVDEKLVKQRRYRWKHPRDAEGKPARIRYSLAALQVVNEAIDGRELGSLIPLEPGELVPVIAREEPHTMIENTNVSDVVEMDVDDEKQPGTALTLFQTSDPAVALARMTEHAKLLVDVVRDRKLSQRIGNREHLRVEAWTTLGGMLGVYPVVMWTRPNESDDGYVARVEARLLDGRIVGAAEAECSRAEPTWAKRPPYALRSMAQTRATSRALRAPLGQIVTLAGYEAAGVEELPAPAAASATRSDSRKPATKTQMHEIAKLIPKLEELAPARDWRAYCRELVEGSPDGLTYGTAARVLSDLDRQISGLEGGEAE